MSIWSDDRADHEHEAIEAFLRSHFPSTYFENQSDLSEYDGSDEEISDAEHTIIEALVSEAETQFKSSKGTLGLAIDFVVLAEELAEHDDWLAGYDPDITVDDILDRYESTAKSSLTLKRGSTREGIRTFHNELIELFREDLNRTNFPSSPGHHTGEWERYDDMLELAFRLSRDGRVAAAQELFDLGLERLESSEYERRDPPFEEPFLKVLRDYTRKAPNEQGGSAYQALCYGYVKAEWPHLSLRASKVRTGSSRQQRYGDIDGYHGPDLMISVEVKDRVIDESNVSAELGTMMKVAQNTTAIAIAICTEVGPEARKTLEDADVRVLDDGDLARRLRFWDYHKQNRGLHGMVHFFANIEENPDGVQRLLRFVSSIDPDNRVLDHLAESDVQMGLDET
ncbi:hypothetical protein EXE51_15905 [Halorubrum sp. CGM5_25_10-8B]|uniref:hypothetical protein n=1 Tax=Halorubrum sp. CGM5_25_10-8B TaxID=2518115 RepID=UPI0010F83779|nr:hypothetical protein [Halorubrum sp. CGM5_25_10-8B]TKX35156.1 hypothetical protein EXE51_15905 [Halorubrum sp. CGM5_25_10-8B]